MIQETINKKEKYKNIADVFRTSGLELLLFCIAAPTCTLASAFWLFQIFDYTHRIVSLFAQL